MLKNIFKRKESEYIENKEKEIKIEKNIKRYVESFFENVYYSPEVFDVKEKIIQKINEEYIKEKEINKKNPFEVMVQKYNNLDSMVKSINYDPSIIDSWFNKEVTTTYDEFKKEFKHEKIFIYLISLLSILALECLLNAILYYSAFLPFFTLFLVFLVADVIVIKKYYRKPTHALLPIDSREKLENLFDRYSKKSLIWLFLAFIKLFDIMLNLISLSLNSKRFEMVEELRKMLPSFDIVTFFLLKNLLIMRWLNKKIEYEKMPKYRKAIGTILIVSTIYYAIALLLNYEFDKIFVFNPCFALILIYCIFATVYYLFGTKKMIYNNKSKKGMNTKMNLLILIPLAAVALLGCGYLYLSRDIWMVQPVINSTPYIYEGNHTISYNDQIGVFTIISNKEDFKMLQLTDIHLGGGVISYDKDKKAIEAAFKLINYTRPDLVVVTGDLTYPVGLSSFSFNNKTPVTQFAAFMRNTRTPWVFTYGNHDTESIAIGSEEDLNKLYQSLSWNNSKNLLYPYVQPKVNGKQIWGRNNQLIELRNTDGTLNQALFLIDSNAYVGKGFSKYDYIHDDQVEWYKNEVLRLQEEEKKTISTLEFFHIPLQQYKIAYDLFNSGSDEVKYYFGFNGEKTKDKVCASKYPSKLFDTAKELNTTKGFFCGHDHYNNMSLEYQGIRLTYGMSIDYLVEPGIARDTKQRGGTLITAHKDSSVDIEQIPLINIEGK